jgi:alpha-glucosidase
MINILHKTFFLVFVLLSGIPVLSAQEKVAGSEQKLQSPDGKLQAVFYQKTDANGKSAMFYSLNYKDKSVILESEIDIQLDNHIFENAMALKKTTTKKWCEDLVIANISQSKKDTVWKPLYGERSQIRDNFNQLTISLHKKENKNYAVNLALRLYNEGLAIRFEFPENPTGIYYKITSENINFTMPDKTLAYFTSWAQGAYQLLPLANWPDESERPLTLKLENGLYASLLEANLTDYVRTKFKLHPEKPNTIVTSLYESVDLVTDFVTPWRVVMLAETPGKLIENNDISLNLSNESKIAETSWIKPGKIMRETTLTTQGALASIDFAAAHNLQYILFDWKWYGPALTFHTDARKVVAPIDMPKVVEYGKQKGVGVWLYVNHQSLQLQDDEIFPLFKSWGIKGVKFGFVELGSHRWTVWLEELIKKAADNQLMVNIHDEYRPTGTSRTWPNVLTQEGIRGNEEFPDATHNTILPFTRGLCGAGDYTVCYYDKRLKTTHAHQLALAAIYYSPLQTLFWYDKPGQYKGEPEIEFFEKIPTVFDETKVLTSNPGEFIAVARRSGNSWFVGTITNNDARELKLDFSFLPALPKGKKYMATVFSDDPSIPTNTKVKVEQIKLDISKPFTVKLQASGGQAMIITEM